MKKSLIALAVLAASGAAMAQSSVSLYGVADVWFGSVKAGAPGARTSQTVVESGGVTDSRWGLKGSEDLGGGLKANFLLEQGFSLDNGAAAPGFNRQAYVSLSSNSFGEVKLGKVATAYDSVSENTYSAFDSALSAPKHVFKSWNNYNWNPANTVAYSTPEFGGISGGVSYSLGENKDTPVAGRASSVTALSAKYEGGPVYVGFAHQIEKPQAAGDSTKYTLLNASYDLGVAKVLADYAQYKLGAAKTNEYHIGVDVPLASNLVVSGGYAYSKDKDGAVATDEKRNGFGLAVAYILSKRTTAYAGLTQAETENAASGNTTNKTNIYAVGVKHTF